MLEQVNSICFELLLARLRPLILIVIVGCWQIGRTIGHFEWWFAIETAVQFEWLTDWAKVRERADERINGGMNEWMNRGKKVERESRLRLYSWPNAGSNAVSSSESKNLARGNNSATSWPLLIFLLSKAERRPAWGIWGNFGLSLGKLSLLYSSSGYKLRVL